jgi:hypothetical protein
MTMQTRRTRALLLLTWSTVFSVQFLLDRHEPEGVWLQIVTAVLQLTIIIAPAVLLFWAWRASQIQTWQRGAVIWWVSLVIMFALALHHVHAIRTISAQFLPYSAYAVGNLTSGIVLTIALPAGLVLVLTWWVITHRKTKWQVLDVATVFGGICALLFLCFMGGIVHPLEHVSVFLSDTWRSLTCTVFPIALGVITITLWISRR